jgi:hypothetical protein
LFYSLNLRVVDLRNTSLSSFPTSLLTSLDRLEDVMTDSYKLCCVHVLPAHFNVKRCHCDTEWRVSSCDWLLKNKLDVAVVAAVSVLGLLGNAGSVLSESGVGRSRRVTWSPSAILLGHLTLSHLAMALALAVLGVADLW